MSARNSAKAIVLSRGKILVNRCVSRFGEYYALPGGGQRTGEMLTETVRRELLEETGYTVTPIRLSGIYERISEGREDGANHKIYFIFLCKLEDVPCRAPTQRDRFQIGREWIDVHSAFAIPSVLCYTEKYERPLRLNRAAAGFFHLSVEEREVWNIAYCRMAANRSASSASAVRA